MFACSLDFVQCFIAGLYICFGVEDLCVSDCCNIDNVPSSTSLQHIRDAVFLVCSIFSNLIINH